MKTDFVVEEEGEEEGEEEEGASKLREFIDFIKVTPALLSGCGMLIAPFTSEEQGCLSGRLGCRVQSASAGTFTT